MIVAQRSLGQRTITKTFSALAWQLLGNDKQGWVKMEDIAENKVLTEPPTGDDKVVTTDANGKLNQTVDNKAAKKEDAPIENKMQPPTKEPATGEKEIVVPVVTHSTPGNEPDDVKLPYLSKDYPTAKDAIAAMDTLTSKEQVQAFIKGEDRAKVLKHAQVFLG